MLSDGDLVQLHFHGTLDDGAVFDSSRGRGPRYFVLGRGQLIPAFEEVVRAMTSGEVRRFRLEPAQAYGAHDASRVYEAPREQAPPDVRVGDEVALSGGRPATVTRVEGESLTVDANHPLAGLALTFEVELLSVRPAAS